MYHYSNMQHYPAEWQDYRFPPQDVYNDYHYDPYYSTVYGTSSISKHRKDKKNRRTSASQDQYEFYDRNRDYYKELKQLKKQLNRPRSATNFRDTQNSIVLENGPLLMQPSSYVNYPMMMPDPMIDHQPGLGACTTDLMMPSQNDFGMVPPPMIQQQQPYYMQFPFFPNMMMPLFNNAMPTNPIKTDTETTTEPAAAPVETTPVKEPSVEPAVAPQPIQRRRSMMDSILSAFALPNTSDIPRPHSTMNEATRQMPQNNDSPTQQSSPASSNQKLEIHLSPGSDRSSMKLHQKIHALQSRQYLWCYKSPSGMRVAFDVKNQAQLDAHSDKEDVLVLTKQSHVPGPLYISVKSKKAWYNAPNPIVFDVIRLPTENSQFIVPPEPTVKRSKSLDMTSKLFSNVLNW